MSKEFYRRIFDWHFSGIPQNWKAKRVGDIFMERTETSSDTVKYPLHSLTIEDGVTPKTDRYERSFLLKDKNDNEYKIVYPNDFVFNPMNLRFGAIAHSKLSIPVTVSAYYNVLEPRYQNYEPIFLSGMFTSHEMMNVYDVIAIGSLVEKRRVHWSILEDILIPFPPLEEQRAIADILGTWDEAIALTESLINTLQKRKKGLKQMLLTGYTRFPEFDGEWNEKPIREILKEVSRKVNLAEDSEYSLLSVRRGSEGVFHREVRTGDEMTQAMYEVKEDDFLISKRQVVHGATALVSEDFDGYLVSNAYHALRAKKGNDIRFFNWLAKTPYLYHLSYIASHGIHIEKLFFVLDAYMKQTVNMPPTEKEQAKIADVLNTVEETLSTLSPYVEQLHQQKKGLMQQLLTGQVRVKVEDENG